MCPYLQYLDLPEHAPTAQGAAVLAGARRALTVPDGGFYRFPETQLIALETRTVNAGSWFAALKILFIV